MQGIYQIENTINHKLYIGSSINCHKRANRHFSELKNNKHKNKHLQNSYNKYGKEVFVFSILEEVLDKINLINKEQYYINILSPAFNINQIANSSLGVERSDITKEKIRVANLGLKHPEWRNKIKSEAQSGDNHWTKKKSFSDESKLKMSHSQKALYTHGYISPRKGKAPSAYTITRLKEVCSIPIQQFDKNMHLVREWPSATEAGKFGFSSACINKCINGKRKTHKNFIWKKITTV